MANDWSTAELMQQARYYAGKIADEVDAEAAQLLRHQAEALAALAAAQAQIDYWTLKTDRERRAEGR